MKTTQRKRNKTAKTKPTAKTPTKVSKPKKTATTEEAYVYKRPEEIALHDEVQYRPVSKTRVDEYVNDIAKNGLLHPLTVWDGEADAMQVGTGSRVKEIDPCFLVAGKHRFEAIKKLKRTDKAAYDKQFPEGIPLKFIQGDLKVAICAQLRENVHREKLKMDQILPTVKRLKDKFGLRQNAIAIKIGKSTAYVAQLLSIGKSLGDEAEDAIIAGDLSVQEALKAVKEVKAGKDKSEVVDSAKKKTKEKKASGKERAEKRISLKEGYRRFEALPRMATGTRFQLLQKLVQYCVGESNSLPKELKKA